MDEESISKLQEVYNTHRECYWLTVWDHKLLSPVEQELVEGYRRHVDTRFIERFLLEES